MMNNNDLLKTIYAVQHVMICETDAGALKKKAAEALESAPFIHKVSFRLSGSDAQDHNADGSACSCESVRAVPVTCEGEQYGELAIEFHDTCPDIEAIVSELIPVARSLGLCLKRIQQNESHHKLESELLASKQSLDERVKELRCLYAISKLIEKRGISLYEIYRGSLQFIQKACQYPDITCARIMVNDRVFQTPNYQETEYNIAHDIEANGEKIGFLEVGYISEKPVNELGPFLTEENALITTIAERLGKVAEHINMQTILQEQETSFRDLVENSLIGIVIIQNGQVVYMNSEQERISTYLPDIFARKDWACVHSDDVRKVRTCFANILSGKKQRIDINFRFYPSEKRTDFKWVYCRISTVEYKGKDALLLNIMDVTRSRHLEGLLRVKDKMASLGHVAAGIAHEIRNPLSGINIYLNALDKITRAEGGPEKIHEIIGQMQSASGKIESVIRRVMDFSKPTEPKLVPADLNQPIREAIDLSSVTLRKVGITIEPALDSNLPMCYADPLLIEQVIMNLITNSAEAMKTVDGPKKIEIVSRLTRKKRFSVTVSDSGPGVPVELKEKVFDPFYSTKNGNTGIGLSLCHRIVSDHGGTLDVGVSKWGGAQFIMELPLKEAQTHV